jgi:DNA-3-methyladenine glycosylase
MTPRLPRLFYQRDAVTLARALVGQRLVRVIDGRRLAGVIVETEAYLGVPDMAAHTYNGRRTPRNQTMWGEGGCLYVYFTYGMHHCANVVARREGEPEAVLLRALEPVEGLDAMRRRRAARFRGRDTDLCSGPAKLCQALGIDRGDDGVDLTRGGALFIERLRSRAYPSTSLVVTRRVGVDYAGEWAAKPLRFYLKGNPHVSRP